MEVRPFGDLSLWQSPLLAAVPGIVHCVTTRKGGVSKAPFDSTNFSQSVGDDRESVDVNRGRLERALGLESGTLMLHTQAHGDRVHRIETRSDKILEGDGFFTIAPQIPMIIGIADCFPVLVASEDGGVVSVFHCGWRGTVKGILGTGLNEIAKSTGYSPDSMVAAIGPGIGRCCFEVGKEVADQFEFVHSDTSGSTYVDLQTTLVKQLCDSGLSPGNIDTTDSCTACNPELSFSHRASGGNTGRMVALVAMI